MSMLNGNTTNGYSHDHRLMHIPGTLQSDMFMPATESQGCRLFSEAHWPYWGTIKYIHS